MSYLANSPSNNYFFPMACNVEQRHDKFDAAAPQQCIFSALMIKDLRCAAKAKCKSVNDVHAFRVSKLRGLGKKA